jgi:hypothetical protein
MAKEILGGSAFEGAIPVERTRLIVDGVMDGLADEAGGNYYGLIPPKFRHRVDGIVAGNFERYSRDGRFTNMGDFRQAVSEAWIGQYRVFPELVSAAGYEPLTGRETREDIDDATMVGLTESSSIAGIGPGSMFAKDAAHSYQPISFREGSGHTPSRRNRGTGLEAVPRVGEQLKRVFKDKDGVYPTSPLISVHGRVPIRGERPMQALDRVNTTTVLGFDMATGRALRPIDRTPRKS